MKGRGVGCEGEKQGVLQCTYFVGMRARTEGYMCASTIIISSEFMRWIGKGKYAMRGAQ